MYYISVSSHEIGEISTGGRTIPRDVWKSRILHPPGVILKHNFLLYFLGFQRFSSFKSSVGNTQTKRSPLYIYTY